MSETIVTVTPTGQPVCEGGVHYKKGEPMQVTATRAKALAGLVTEINPTVEPPAQDEQPPMPPEEQPPAAPVEGKKKK